ncbi:MAG: D-alanyl-D-alanine carboxypeptidase [Actinobacteria bacterium]|nr:D-alanyl-D-alanine carboxypeptidase [Actinomycetota bacterium]
MKRVLGALVSSALVAVMVPATASGALAQEAGEPRASILVDADTGAILEAKNAHEALPVAGAVKLMTALTALQRIPLEDRVLTTPNAVDAPEPTLGMRENTTWALEDLVQAMLLSSANDAAYTLAEGSAGSLDEFIAEMERVGKMMGLEDSTFLDPAGIDDASAYRGGSVMSAYDLAVVGVNVLASTELAEIAQFEAYRVKTPDGEESDLRENVNDFVQFYPGATGLMAGFTATAGAVQVASAKRDGRHLVAVVISAENAIASASGLLDAGFGAKNPKGTGDFVPATRITTLQGRLVALAGLPRPLGSPAIPTTGAKGPNAPVAEGPPPQPPRPTVDDEGGGGGGFPYLLVLAMFIAAGLVIAAVLRGRNVQRERLHRRARERYLAQARRRGTIDVVDPEVAADPADVRIVRR